MSVQVSAMVCFLHDTQRAIAALCARFGAARLDVFGSALREDFRPGESDVDLLVEFTPMEAHRLADSSFGLLDALRALLGGDVDLVKADAVTNRYLVRGIERTEQPIYAA